LLHRKALRVKSADFAKSGSLFQSFLKEDRQPYPDHPPLTWTLAGLGEGGGLDYVQRKLHESFLTVVT
ncbi:hypothetical protein QVM33_29825, partial [Pseudomonas aeruginosa]